MGNAANKMRKLVGRRRALVPGPPPVAFHGAVDGVVLGKPLSGLDVAGEWQEYDGEVVEESALPEAVKKYAVAPKTFAGLRWVLAEGRCG